MKVEPLPSMRIKLPDGFFMIGVRYDMVSSSPDDFARQAVAEARACTIAYI
jgi:hypothetical protein